MSDIFKTKLPKNLPECPCFQSDDVEETWARCGCVARINNVMCTAFHQLIVEQNLCATAVMFTIENTITTLLAYAAKSQNNHLLYGSVEIERVAEVLLMGLEERVLAASRHSYENARAFGLTEENMHAMREADGHTKQ